MRTVSFGTGRTQVPVGKILCLGRNYAEHAREMHDVVPKKPIVFLKPATALIHSGEIVTLPKFSSDVQHEVELVVLIGRDAKGIRRDEAYGHVAGYGVGLDMTLRDLQGDAKRNGLPWTVAKGFDTSAPVSDFIEKEMIADPHNLPLSLKVNNTLRQQANTGAMLFRIDQVIAYLSEIFTLEAGDLIFTGTPEGVARVVPGDRLEARLGTFASLSVRTA